MRVLNYPFTPNTALVLDRYGNKRGGFPLKQGENLLPFTQKGCMLKDSFGNAFFIYEGEGVLEFADALKFYDFECLECENVEEYLMQGNFKNASSAQKRMAKEWVECYDLNLEKGAEYLTPNGFIRIEEELLNG
ncbi:hypothetical protein LS70_003935 [Helicobacter sp. MIT 11-5569]|uniref:hypothetical protein n=1 Tax=Helicobacter sp. MIT 11-5569 TaxID=1548151 RepID=UPI00051F8B8F|nr:hypothetical protein [Helicobacter sp. MIT 11-5569]TLD83966.1 hypothetical protein LS70_003935 [Helicobacter sp. MIT 11-5569]